MTQEPWYANGLRFTCTQCGKCCRTHGDYRYVFLTPEDITSLASVQGLPRRDFLHQFTETDPNGLRVLKWPNEQCVFFDGQRCGVYEARPLQCRTWPFWPENMKHEVWHEEVLPFCPGSGQGTLHSLAELKKTLAIMEAGDR